MTNGQAHRRLELDGVPIFYREAGPADAPVLLLPHGYPCSSFQFRRRMPALADRWRTIAFDWPGFGYSGTADRTVFAYDFDAYADVLGRVADALGLERYILWLHDYGSQIGLLNGAGHWLLETHFDEALPLVRGFLARIVPNRRATLHLPRLCPYHL
jgi:alpha-beta hydrolase superfamily lysophospholipase